MLVTDTAGISAHQFSLSLWCSHSNVSDKPGFSFVVLISILIGGSEILVAIKNVLKTKTFTRNKDWNKKITWTSLILQIFSLYGLLSPGIFSSIFGTTDCKFCLSCSQFPDSAEMAFQVEVDCSLHCAHLAQAASWEGVSGRNTTQAFIVRHGSIWFGNRSGCFVYFISSQSKVCHYDSNESSSSTSSEKQLLWSRELQLFTNPINTVPCETWQILKTYT